MPIQSGDPLWQGPISLPSGSIQNYGAAISTSGDTVIIPAPGAGLSINVLEITLQSESGTANTALIKQGAADASPHRVRCPADGSGVNKIYGKTDALTLPTNTALVINLSAASAVGVSARYTVNRVSLL